MLKTAALMEVVRDVFRTISEANLVRATYIHVAKLSALAARAQSIFNLCKTRFPVVVVVVVKMNI